MAEFLPFRATRYSQDQSAQLVTAPPYDVISPEERDALYARDEHNVIRLILNRDTDPYTSAEDYFHKWIESGVLVRDDSPSFFLYHQSFKTPEGKNVTRVGVLGRLHLSAYSAGEVLPHERTLQGPKRDRMQLMEHVKGNLSPIFGLIDDDSQTFDELATPSKSQAPLAEVKELLFNGETITHRFWKLEDAASAQKIEALVMGKKVIIADGHHRYETSLAYSEAHPELPGAKYTLAFLSNLRGKGTVILPTHRVAHGIPDFSVTQFLTSLREHYDLAQAQTREEGLAALESDPRVLTLVQLSDEPHWIVVRDRTPFVAATPIDNIVVWRLQEEILKGVLGLTQAAIDQKKNLLYPHTMKELDELLEHTKVDASFIVRAVTPTEMLAVVTSGEFMPQKSTFFYPKLLSGLVIHEFIKQV
jgi:uncharacterized protein (DUF1015 family)